MRNTFAAESRSYLAHCHICSIIHSNRLKPAATEDQFIRPAGLPASQLDSGGTHYVASVFDCGHDGAWPSTSVTAQQDVDVRTRISLRIEVLVP